LFQGWLLHGGSTGDGGGGLPRPIRVSGTKLALEVTEALAARSITRLVEFGLDAFVLSGVALVAVWGLSSQ